MSSFYSLIHSPCSSHHSFTHSTPPSHSFTHSTPPIPCIHSLHSIHPTHSLTLLHHPTHSLTQFTHSFTQFTYPTHTLTPLQSLHSTPLHHSTHHQWRPLNSPSMATTQLTINGDHSTHSTLPPPHHHSTTPLISHSTHRIQR